LDTATGRIYCRAFQFVMNEKSLTEFYTHSVKEMVNATTSNTEIIWNSTVTKKLHKADDFWEPIPQTNKTVSVENFDPDAFLKEKNE
jgi:hypothetical protein